jgi:GH25 family lysozyme M1 (1,4-beta-N-acetylmuramidase)
MTIYGWDASDYDYDRGMRPTHIAKAATEGIRFFTHKATEGTSTTHARFGSQTKAAVAAGIPFVGPYVVPRTGISAASQARFAYGYVKGAHPALLTYPGFFWQVDTEDWGYDRVSPALGEAVCLELEKLTPGRRAVHYAPQWSYNGNVPNPSRPLWSSNYGSNQAAGFKPLYFARGGDAGPGWSPYSGRVPKIWQYGSKAIIGGQPTCDANAFRGTDDDFATMIGALPMTTVDDVITAEYQIWTNIDKRTAPAGQPDYWGRHISDAIQRVVSGALVDEFKSVSDRLQALETAVGNLTPGGSGGTPTDLTSVIDAIADLRADIAASAKAGSDSYGDTA